MKRTAKIIGTIVGCLLLAVGFIALRVFAYRNTGVDIKADAAIVLGAAVWGKDPSPVFQERINHALDLYRNGKVRRIIFTGGQGNPNEPTESAAARQYAIDQGVPLGDIFVEESSHSTYENLFFARQIAATRGLNRVLIVSDPLHMKRALIMANDLGFEAYPSPTPTSRYRRAGSQARSLGHETYYYIGYLFKRPFLKPPTIKPRTDYAARILGGLPSNWDLTESDHEIVIFRKEPVAAYSCTSMDVVLLAHPDRLKEHVEEFGSKLEYKIRLRFAPLMELSEYAKLQSGNDQIKLAKFSPVQLDREFYEDDSKRSFDPRYRELPKYYDQQSSIYLQTTLVPWGCVYPDEVAIECENVRQNLDAVFRRYSVSPGRSLHR